MNEFNRTYYNVKKDNPEWFKDLEECVVPEFVRLYFRVDSWCEYKYTLSFEDYHPRNQFEGTRTIIKLYYNSKDEQFYIETWTWNHKRNSDGSSTYIKISERVAKEMFYEHLEKELNNERTR